jgi:hypothetical protein
MRPDDEDEKRVTEEVNPPFVDPLIDEDMPCIKCGYNLRGLQDQGQCPECGTKIAETLDFILAKVLCPVCLAPNHPSVSVCERCGSPVSGAASTADYYRTKPIYGAKRNPPREDEEPNAPSSLAMVFCWGAGIVLVGILTAVVIDLWADYPDAIGTGRSIEWRTLWSVVVILLSAVPATIIYFPTRNYRRLHRQYDKSYSIFLAKEALADAAERHALPEE